MKDQGYLKNCTCAYIALLTLLALTFGLAYAELGQFNTPLSLLIACAKALLIALIFMDLKASSGPKRWLTAAAAVSGVTWLMILILLSLGDYFSRGWMSLPGSWP